MTKNNSKIVLIILITCLFGNILFSQTIKNQNLNLKLVIDSLIGEWELESTIYYLNNDSTKLEPSSAPIGMTSAKPPTTIQFDRLQSFKISQWCMKCPLIDWSGNYTLEIKKYKETDLFYLIFIEKRDKYLKKGQKSLTNEFNGYLTTIESGIFKLNDNKGCTWIYERKKKTQ